MNSVSLTYEMSKRSAKSTTTIFKSYEEITGF